MRSKWKVPHLSKSIVKHGIIKKKKQIIIYSRQSIITHHFIGKICLVHNGHAFRKVRPTIYMVGHKFGEFSSTKRRAVFKKRLKHGK